MNRIKVGVIRGGPSSEYEVSLNTGAEVLKHLPEHYQGSDILIDKEGQWHLDGFPKQSQQVFKSADVLFNALHGEFGEDGKVQQIFESSNVLYTGSGVFSSAVAMNKHLAQDFFRSYGLKIPKVLVFKKDSLFDLDAEDCANQVFNSMSPPWVVKPSSVGSSVGISICNSFPELISGIQKATSFGNVVLAEEYIKGREATCGILENFRRESCYALPVVEIIPPEGHFFDYDVKYDGSTKEICPAGFDILSKTMIEETARMAHQVLGCRHYSRADFMVSPRGIYLLEVNTLPGLTSESLFPKAAEAAGLSFPQLLDHIIKLALNRR